jgi:hypothetical protein
METWKESFFHKYNFQSDNLLVSQKIHTKPEKLTKHKTPLELNADA